MIHSFKSKATLLTGVLCYFANAAFAQHAPHSCAVSKIQHRNTSAALKGTIADTAEALYDVNYVKLDVALSNLNSTITGNTITNAITTAPAAHYVFELTSDLVIDSLKINGMTNTFTTTGDVVRVPFVTTLPSNTNFQAQVYYHGTVVAGSSFFDRGLRNILSTASNKRFTFTLAQPYAAKDFWPCKQDLQDKIDSSDVWITVDTSLKAGSNGTLQQITNISTTKKRYEWKNRTPIDYYLISAAVGPYTEYSYYMHFDNSTDSMLVQNYIYPNTLPVRKSILDSTALMINYFSDIFNRYPFWKDKYGHCQAPLSGGMEHQTMTTLGIWTDNIVAHELAHQWFGDNVTCGTWKDIWLNEGFASYAEYLFEQHFKGSTAARNKISEVHNDAMYPPLSAVTDPSGVLYVTDTADISILFSSQTSYNKGSSVVHMLRFLANNDSVFFRTLHLYQQQFANSTATTEQFKALVAQEFGMNVDTFFNQWVYKSGWPIFHATWNQSGNNVYVNLNQQVTGNNALFCTPLEIKLAGPQGDTTIRVYTNTLNPSFTFNWTKPVTGIVIDPNDWLLDQAGVVTRDNTLSITNPLPQDFAVYPNPAHDQLNIKHDGEGLLEITDLTGKSLLSASLKNKSGVETVNISQFAAGLYLYRLYNTQGTVAAQGKLIKQ